MMGGVRRSLIAVVALAVVVPLTVTACKDNGNDDAAAAPVAGASASAAATAAGGAPGGVTATDKAESTTAASAASIAVTPADGRTGVPVSAEIGVKVSGGTVKTVSVKDARGGAVSGALRDDGSSWVPSKPLKNKQRYAATVTAADTSGAVATRTTSFTTMTKPARTTGTGLYLFNGNTYGVAMPVVVEFNPGIKKADRAGVQKRLFVKTDPPQPGTWSWTSSGTQAYYRAPQFWQTGTKLSVRVAVGGLPTGGGRYGDQDRSASAKIGRSLIMKVENSTKKMTVIKDGKTIRTMPVSLGKRSTPSSSGTMVVMDKQTSTVFDTTDTDGAAGYKETIAYAQRLTWSGQYIHSAPWSVGDQGHRNVSHGCVNLSPSNARWIFGQTLIGDPITVHGTSDKLVYGNGWTPWNLSWKEFSKGSALPVPADLG
jgi:lipoprotein-anchoring transpeptidase ErfK/SrfK